MTGQSTRKRRAMTEQAADAAVDQACRSLRLPTIRSRFTEIADAAEREQLTYRGFLAELLNVQVDRTPQEGFGLLELVAVNEA